MVQDRRARGPGMLRVVAKGKRTSYSASSSQGVDWTNVLSLGEQQRVSFARLLLEKPPIAFLDEATSALDEPNEQLLYERLRELAIAYVSVGHRSTLKQFHYWLLVLHVDGSWELDPIEPEAADARAAHRKERVKKSG